MVSKNKKIKVNDFFLQSSNEESEIFVKHYSYEKYEFHVFLVHGALEHSGRHLGVVDYLLDTFDNIALTVFDHQGHGKSGGGRAYVEKFDDYVTDLNQVIAFIQKGQNKNVKNFILAHSLGGLITLSLLLNSELSVTLPLNGLIFTSPCIRPQTILAPLSISVVNYIDKISPKLHLPMIYSGKDLTRDPERANDFDVDPLIPKYISVRMAKQIMEASHKIIGLSYYLKYPSLFLIAGADKVVDPHSTELFARGVEKELTQIIYYSNHYHELLNEIDREKIYGTISDWINTHLS